MRFDDWSAALLVLATVACSGQPVQQADGPPATVADVTVEARATFRLRPGEVASITEGDRLVRFVGVEGDSRCPVDVACVWAGSAEVVLALAGPDRRWSRASLHTGVEPRQLDLDGATLALLDVEPSPRSDVPIDPARYVAVLRLTP